MKKIISLAICLVLALSLAGCSKVSDEAATNSTSDANSIAGFEYYHYEPDGFSKTCEKLEKLASSDDSDQVLSLYDDLYDQCLEMETLYSVAYVKHSINQSDKYYSDEQQYSYDNLQECLDKFGGVCRRITEGPSAQAFKEHVGKKVFNRFARYKVMTSEEKALLSEENKLVDRYFTEYDKVSYTSGSEKWTFDRFFGPDGDKLSEKNYSRYVRIYDGLFRELNQRTGPIYLDLLKLRVKEAKEEGYDSYAEYADREIYHRDYSPEELEQFHADVKKVALEYYDIFYSSLIADPPAMNTDQILDTLEKYSGEISSMAGSSCEKLIDRHLYSIGSEKRRMETGYTLYLDKPEVPFIYDYADSSGGFRDISHEFGHFVQADNFKSGNIIVSEDNTDLAEIASNGFECLMTHYYDEIYASSGEDATKLIIMDMFGNIIDGCIQDEFQRRVYEDPDMTLEEINRTFADVEAEYMGGYSDGTGYYWCFVPHNFESPLYYISYSLSGIASLQIWDKSQNNFKGACRLWEKVVRQGCTDRKYLEVIDKVGMKKFTENGAVDEICRPALKYLKK